MQLNIFELRNYLIQPAMRDHFIDYFEHLFIFSQQDVQMYVLGQFRVIDAPDRFVWVRAFTDMATRLAGLRAFYGGPVWQKYRERANAMIVDSDHVHLLRPLAGHADLTRGRTPDTIGADLDAGTISPETGVIRIDFYQTDPAELETVARHIVDLYRGAGIQVRGVLAAELAENDFPALPAIQNPGEFVIISAYECEAQARQRPTLPLDRINLSDSQNSLLLAPTLRSPLRW